ncbi:MAG: cardiolipin synthase [Candidatus Izemoplasmataceae bacterium]
MEKSIRKITSILFLVGLAIFTRVALELVYKTLNIIYEFSPSAGFLIRTLFLVLVIIIWLSVTLRSENPYNKLPWLLILAFEPVIGITLFLTFGRSFKNSYRYKKRPLIKSNDYITKEDSPLKLSLNKEETPEYIQEIFETAHKIAFHQPFNDTAVRILQNGESFYPDLIEKLKEAQSFILFETYIFRSDTRGNEIIDILIDKASNGIKVFFIVDGFGSVSRMSLKSRKRLKQSAVEFIINDRVYFPFFNTRLNFRNHRKIVVIDGLVGYTGGMNIGDEYDNSILYDYHFRDTQVCLEGAAVSSLTTLFFKDYYYNKGIHITDDFYYPKTKVRKQSITQILQSGPESDEANIRNVYLKMIFKAKKSIKIMTPYMALDQEIYTALKVAQLSGVNVEIIIPGIPDKYLVYKVTQYFAHAFARHGIKIYVYQPGFSHSKILMIDDCLASVGSYNLDNRSAIIDFEVSALFNDKEALHQLVIDFEQDKKDSTLIDPSEKRPIFAKFFEGIMSIFTPII